MHTNKHSGHVSLCLLEIHHHHHPHATLRTHGELIEIESYMMEIKFPFVPTQINYIHAHICMKKKNLVDSSSVLYTHDAKCL